MWTAHSEIPASGNQAADRRTVQLQFAWCVSRKLLDRNKLAHGASLRMLAAVRRLFFPMMGIGAQDTALFAFGQMY